MTTRAVIAVAVVALCACVEPTMPDGGSGGGGGATTGGGGGTTGGGSTTGGGTGAPFDAGHLGCTFEPSFQLAEVSGNARAQVAVTESGNTIYAWNGAGDLTFAVQSPDGGLTSPVSTLGNTLTDNSLVASGNRALLVYASASAQLYENRFVGGTTMSPGVVTQMPLTGYTASYVALEPSGAASVWLQQSGMASRFDEFTTDGVAVFGGPREVVDAGFFYSTGRSNGRRLIISLPGFTATAIPEVIVSSGVTDQHTPMTGAMVTGNDSFHGAIADDGSAVAAGLFSLSGVDGVGAMLGSNGTFGAAQIITPLPDAGVTMLRTMGALAGPEGRAAVVWWQEDALYFSKRSGGAWSAPMNIASAPGVIPRFTKIGSSRGLVHFFDAAGSKVIEVNVDGAVGAMTTELSGATYGTEYAAGGSYAAVISMQGLEDGGFALRAAQCR